MDLLKTERCLCNAPRMISRLVPTLGNHLRLVIQFSQPIRAESELVMMGTVCSSDPKGK